MERLDNSFLTKDDIALLDKAAIRRAGSWRDYVHDKDSTMQGTDRMWREFPPVIPYAIVDGRIVDLALTFWDNPDDTLLKGYRRLEDIVRKRSKIDEHGSKLFSQAFRGSLNWENLDEGEKNGRMNLFTSAYMAYRNPRAHRELEGNSHNQLREFLLLNLLYTLESDLVVVK